jgi:predicted RNA-binding protein YlxR (DUF448 family)
MKKIVQRTCVGCNVKKDKRELLRIVKSKDDKITIDKTGKLPGRGAYICGDEACFNQVIKSKRLERALETHIENEIYESLRGVIIDKSK